MATTNPTQGDLVTNPNAPWTKMRSVRLGSIWDTAKDKAHSEDRTLTDVIDEALVEYVDEDAK